MPPKKSLTRGLFITFEGFEGSGKSTQIKLLENFLGKQKYPIVVLREPGSTEISEAVRKILLDKKNHISEKAELLLYVAARAQIVEEKILPALKAHKIVLCDRFQDATVAYQGFGLGIDRGIIDVLGAFATGGRMPDVTLLLDVEVQEGLKRRGKNKDRIEQRSLEYHRRVREGYLAIAKDFPARVKVIQAKDIAKTHREIRSLVAGLLCRLRK